MHGTPARSEPRSAIAGLLRRHGRQLRGEPISIVDVAVLRRLEGGQDRFRQCGVVAAARQRADDLALPRHVLAAQLRMAFGSPQAFEQGCTVHDQRYIFVGRRARVLRRW